MPSLDQVLAAASLREESVDVCVAGELNARWEDLGRQLAVLLADSAGEHDPGRKMSEAPPGLARRTELADEMEQLRQRMLEASFTFLFRALPRREYRDLRDEHPPRRDRGESMFNASTFPPALIRRSLVDPPIASDADFEQLLDKLTEGQVTELFSAAHLANEGGSDVPKSVPASARNPGIAPS